MSRRKSWLAGFSLTELMIVISIISILALIGTVNYSRSRARANYQACVENVKNIASANELYAREKSDHYPTALAQLTPNYIKRIPTCPSVGFTTYSTGYTAQSNPDMFTIFCSGTNHRGVVNSNFPQYTSQAGLREQ